MGERKMIEFENNEELESYVEEHKIIEESITCDFNISLMTDLIVKGNITAEDINAVNINACDINANDIKAMDINANDINSCNINANDINACNIDVWDINYYAVCLAYNDIKCKNITGRKDNHKHFVLDGKIIIKDDKDYLIKNGIKYEVKIIKEVKKCGE